MKKKYTIPRDELADDLADALSEMNEYLKILLDTAEDISDTHFQFKELIKSLLKGTNRKKIIQNYDQIISTFQRTYDSMSNVQNNFTHILKWLYASRDYITKTEGKSMSGGALDYADYRFREVAERLMRSDVPEYRALAKHIWQLSEVIHEVEWVLSGDSSPGKDIKMIIDLLGNAKMTQVKIDELRSAISEAEGWIKILSGDSHSK